MKGSQNMTRWYVRSNTSACKGQTENLFGKHQGKRTPVVRQESGFILKGINSLSRLLSRQTYLPHAPKKGLEPLFPVARPKEREAPYSSPDSKAS